jgi:FkbM family methyltransferase
MSQHVNYSNPLGAFDRIAGTLLTHIRPAGLASAFKAALHRRRLTVETPNGKFLVDPLSLFGRELASTGDYEPKMRRTIAHYLKPGHVFVDLGANEGYFSVQAAKICGPRGFVLAVEPQDRVLPVLTANLTLNAVRQAKVVNAGVADRSGTTVLHLAPDINSGSSGLDNAARYRVRTQKISVQTLSQILDDSGINHVDLMKVDIEGSEWEMLQGAPEAFANHRIRAMVLEIHNSHLERRGLDPGAIIRQLQSFGYRVEKPYGPWTWLAA